MLRMSAPRGSRPEDWLPRRLDPESLKRIEEAIRIALVLP